MTYRESIEKSDCYRIQYLDSIDKMIRQRYEEATNERNDFFSDVFSDSEKQRNELKEMLGWPLNIADDFSAQIVHEEQLSCEEKHDVSRITFKLPIGTEVTGILFKNRSKKKCPLVIAQHGGGATPERIANMYGDTQNHNGLVTAFLKYEINIFVPQLLLWNNDEYEPKFERRIVDAKLTQVGSSIAAVELYELQCVIKYFSLCDYVENIGMAGLSYGGFYTLLTAALDDNIKAAVSCGFFNDHEGKFISNDRVWLNMAYKMLDAEIACLVYPRKLYIMVGERDDLFRYETAKSEFERLKLLCPEDKQDWVRFIAFDGGHEFYDSDEILNSFIEDLK